LAYLTWDHPRMPWEGTELRLAQFRDGSVHDERVVAGGPEEAIVQPEWSPDGVLHFSSDRTGWWNLYRGDYEPITALEAEIGGPLWVFDESFYAFLDDGRIVATVFSEGTDRLAVRYLINDACVLLKKPLVSAAIHRFEGQAMTYVPGRLHAGRSIFTSRVLVASSDDG